METIHEYEDIEGNEFQLAPDVTYRVVETFIDTEYVITGNPIRMVFTHRVVPSMDRNN